MDIKIEIEIFTFIVKHKFMSLSWKCVLHKQTIFIILLLLLWEKEFFMVVLQFVLIKINTYIFCFEILFIPDYILFL